MGRTIAVLAIVLFFSGLILAGLTPLASPSGEPVPAYVLWGIVLAVMGVVCLGVGELFQKKLHDEWVPWGFFRPPTGPQVMCKHCSGLMNADSGVCPFCGAWALTPGE